MFVPPSKSLAIREEKKVSRWFRYLWRITTLSVILVSVTACGGGESGHNDPPPPPPGPFSKVFFGDQLDPNKWQYLHFMKKIDSGQWASEIARRGTEGINSAFSIPIDGQLNSFQIDATVTEIRDEGAGLDTFIQGRFYKDTTEPGRTGEIIADIRISHLEDSVGLVGVAFVIRCQDADCNDVENLFLDNTSLGSVTTGQAHQLSVEYDQTARTFTFLIDDKSLVFENAPVFATNSESPRVLWGTWVDDIDEDADPAEEGFVAARFDNLFIDGASFQTFENPQDDLVFRTVRWVRNGVAELELARKGIEEAPTLSLRIADSTPVTSSMKSKVFDIEGAGVNGAGAQIGMRNSWYHTGTNTDGATGRVSSHIRIGVNGEVFILAFKCENSNCSSSTELIEDEQKQRIFGTVPLSVPHTLELSWDGVNFFYGLDGRLEMFNPTIKAPNSSMTLGNVSRRIYVRLYNLNESDDEARIEAKIDDVFVDGNPYDDFSPLVNISREFVDPEQNKGEEVDDSGGGGNAGNTGR
jgi:hypothetical protein